MNFRIKENLKRGVEIFFFILIGFFLVKGVSEVPFHGDEASAISMSKDYQKIFNGEIDQVTYSKKGSTEQFHRLTTGTVVPIILFITYKITGIQNDSINNPFLWYQHQTLDDETLININKQYGNIPTTKVLIISRYCLTLFTFLSVILLYYFIKAVTQSRVPSMLSSILYVTTPIILCDGRRAILEGALLLIIILAMYLAIRLVQRTKKLKQFSNIVFWMYLYLGIISGVGIATKHNSFIILFSIFIYIIWVNNYIIKNKHYRLYLNLLTFFSVLIMFTIYFILNPIWWTTITLLALLVITINLTCFSFLFLSKLQKQKCIIKSLLIISCFILFVVSIVPFKTTLITRVNLMRWQSDITTDMNSFSDRSRKIVEELFFNKAESHNVQTKDTFSSSQKHIYLYKEGVLKGRKHPIFLGIILISLTIIGLTAMIFQIIKFRNIRFIGIIVFLFIPLTIMILTNKIPWSRYYLIIQPQLYLIIGISLRIIFDILKRFLTKGQICVMNN